MPAFLCFHERQKGRKKCLCQLADGKTKLTKVNKGKGCSKISIMNDP